MAEWSNAHDSKSCVLTKEHQGFKSLSLRQKPVAPSDGLSLCARILRTPQKPIFGATGKAVSDQVIVEIT